MKYYKFLFSINQKSFTFIVLLFLFTSIFFEYLFIISVPYLLGNVFNDQPIIINIDHFKISKQDLFIYLLSLILIFFLLKNIFFFLNQYLFSKYSYILQNKLSNRLLNKYLNENYSYFINYESSEMFRNVKDNTEVVRALVNNFFILIAELFVFLGLSIIIIYNSTLVSIFSIIFIIFFSFIYIFFSKNLSKKWSVQRQNFEKEKIRYLQESFSGFKELKLFNKQYFFIKNYSEKNNKSNEMSFRFNLLYTFPKVYLEIIGGLGVVLLIILNLSEGDKDSFIKVIPLLGLYFVVFIRILPSVNRILNSMETHRFTYPALKIIFNILSFKKSINIKYCKKNITLSKDIKFKKVYFSFPGKKKIFKNINLQIKCNEKIGIIGDSGIGKTTLVNLISGLFYPTKGTILSDNENIHGNIKSWHQNIAYIYQSTFLMNDTIEANISLKSDKDANHKEKIKIVSKLMNLTNFIKKFPKGLDTIIGDKGAKLSGGQMQRIGIARALYFDRKILICDEITNSLDSTSEKSIINAIRNLDKTIIMISHKKSNLDFCSKIYEVKNYQLNLVKR
jgi:ABC-type bacteriocin/lantibiotic exporter with double-glycine peptidase domain